MEPDKTYPLHQDKGHQPPTSSAPPDTSPDNSSLTPPSDFNPPQNRATVEPTSVPWYLRPLTKTTQSPLTSSQTRPFVPRAPLPLSGQPKSAPEPDTSQASTSTASGLDVDDTPASPFRSPNFQSPNTADTPSLQQQSTYQQSPMSRPTEPKSPLPMPKPFSQFGSKSSAQASAAQSVNKTKKNRSIIAAVLGILLIAGIIFGAYSLWQNYRAGHSQPAQNAARASDEKRLHQALEAHLHTSFVRQEYEQVSGSDVFKFDTTSDFSDPKNPKSYIKYDVQSGSGESVIKSAGEIIVLNADEYFAKLSLPTRFYTGKEVAKPKENQWYRIDATDSVGSAFMDPMSVRMSLNTPMGEVPVGNFSDDDRRNLMRFITERKVYAMQSSDQVTERDRKQTHYSLNFDAALANELNAKIREITGGKNKEVFTDYTNNSVKNMEAWVDNETGKLVKVVFDREYTDGSDVSVKEKVTVGLSYPADGKAVAPPNDAAESPWATP